MAIGDIENKVKKFYSGLEERDEVLMRPDPEETSLCASLYQMHSKKLEGSDLDHSKIQNLFIASLEPLGENMQDYFNGVQKRIVLKRSTCLDNGQGSAMRKDGTTTVFTTDKPTKTIDLMAYAHEMGHIPAYDDKTRKDYFEYGNVLPMFFEYLSCKQLKASDYYRYFLDWKSHEIKTTAQSYLSRKKNNSELGRGLIKVYNASEMRYNMRIIKSLDYTLQLIAKFNANRAQVNQELDDFIIGATNFRQMEGPLKINTNGCKTLLRETKRYRNR